MAWRCVVKNCVAMCGIEMAIGFSAGQVKMWWKKVGRRWRGALANDFGRQELEGGFAAGLASRDEMPLQLRNCENFDVKMVKFAVVE